MKESVVANFATTANDAKTFQIYNSTADVSLY